MAIAIHVRRAVVANTCCGGDRLLGRPRDARRGFARRKTRARARAIALAATRRGIERDDGATGALCLLRRLVGPDRTGLFELVPQPREVFAGGAATLVELKERAALAAFEDSPRQAGEHAGGANFDERADARCIELLDDADPAHGLRHLPDEAFAHARRIDHLRDGGATECRGRRRLDRQRLDRGGQLVGGATEQWRMEGARHGEPLRLHAARFEQNLDGIDDAGRAADHELLGRVFGAHPHLPGKRFERRLHGRAIRDHREHRAIARAMLLDGVGAGSRGPRAVLDRPGGCRCQRGKLAEAVAGHDIGREAHPAQHVPGEQVAEVHRPLRIPDPRAEAVVGPPGDLGERFVAESTGHAIEPLECAASLG